MNKNILTKYFSALVDNVYKILCLYEEENETVYSYTCSLLYELNGLEEIVERFGIEAEFTSLIGTLESISQDCISLGNDTSVIRKEVFKSINVIKKMSEKLG